MKPDALPSVGELPGGELPGEGGEEQVGRLLRKIVGGWLEAVPLREALPPSTVLYCNEEGKLEGLAPSFPIPGGVVCGAAVGDMVCGVVVATGVDEEGETRSLTEGEAAAICRLLTTLRSLGAP